MSRNKWLLIGGLLLLAVCVWVLALRVPKALTPSTKHPAPAREAPTGILGSAQTGPGQAQDSVRPKEDFNPSPDVEEPEDAGNVLESGSGDASESETGTPRERAVRVWESLVDQMIEQTEVPTEAQAQHVKEAFDQLDEEDQADGIHRGLNLLPDEQFPALYAILYDKTEAPEVLDAIFSDALNRPEEIKNPLLKKLRQDTGHPLFFESARILDVVEPAEETP